LGVVRERRKVANAIVDGDAGRDSNTLLDILAFEFLSNGTVEMEDFGGRKG
jgi:hypothetical protein